MAKIPQSHDPTLLAIETLMEANQERGSRAYLGASAIGDSCDRKLWYSFHWVKQGFIEAAGLRRINDGHRGEDVVASMLRLVPSIDLSTHKEDGTQHSFEDLGGHFRGNADGLISGLLQDPTTPYVWECKVVNETKFKKVSTLKVAKGEDEALKHWDYVYYAQAQIYMHYFGTKWHYLTVGSPGVRDLDSIRTPYNQADAEGLIEKARRIIASPRPLARMSENPAWHECKWCSFYGICHQDEMPQKKSCRTCLHSTAVPGGGWKCEHHAKTLTIEDQRAGCSAHLYIPDLIPGEQVNSGLDWVEYLMKDGTVWIDQAK